MRFKIEGGNDCATRDILFFIFLCNYILITPDPFPYPFAIYIKELKILFRFSSAGVNISCCMSRRETLINYSRKYNCVLNIIYSFILFYFRISIIFNPRIFTMIWSCLIILFRPVSVGCYYKIK